MNVLLVLLGERAALLKVLAEHGDADLPITRSMLRTVERDIEALEPGALPRLIGGRPEVPRIQIKSSQASER